MFPSSHETAHFGTPAVFYSGPPHTRSITTIRPNNPARKIKGPLLRGPKK